jgi:tetratricopeptide (TPR) repeat protein
MVIVRRSASAGMVLACAGVVLALAGCSREAVTGTPEELIKEGWADFRLQDFDRAKFHLDGALQQLDKLKAEGKSPAADREMRINALYGLGLVGTVGRIGGGSEEGRKYLQQVIDQAGQSEMAAWAALALVRDKHLPQTSMEEIDIPLLRDLYGKLIDTYPDSQAAEEAFLFRQSLYVETLDQDDSRKAIAAIKAYLGSHEKTKFRSALYTLMNQADVTLKDYRAALDDAIHALETKEIDPTNPNINNVGEYYRIGLMAQYDVGDFATARKYNGKFLAEYKTDQKAFNVKLELKRMDQIEKDLRAGKDPFAAPTTAPSTPAAPPAGRPAGRPAPESAPGASGQGGTR